MEDKLLDLLLLRHATTNRAEYINVSQSLGSLAIQKNMYFI